MLTKWDDYFVHQTSDPIERVSDPDELWLESVCYPVGSIAAGVHLCTGVVSHPNAGVMAGYALTLHKGIQYNFWPSREIAGDRSETSIGPLSYRIVEPMKKWRLKLDRNECTPVSFDIEFTSVAQPCYFKTTPEEAEFGERYSILFEEIRPTGRLSIGGDDYNVEGYWANRSRYWGRRGDWRDVGLFMSVLATFPDYRIYLYLQEGIDGKARMTHGVVVKNSGRAVQVAAITPSLAFERDTRWLRTANLEIVDAEGARYQLNARLSGTGIRFKASPGRLFHEKYGAFHMESETWDLTKRDVVVAAAKWVNHWICEFRNGDEVGHGLLEYAVSRKHRKYGPAL